MSQDNTTPRRRRIVAASGAPGADDPAIRAGRLNRTEFMDWASTMLAARLRVGPIARDGDNNIHHVLEDDVYIGIVATVEETIPSPSPCIRVHVWTYDERRIRRWEHGWRPRGDLPQGTSLCLRVGDHQRVRYLEFSWPNRALDRFQLWLGRVEQCVNFFVTARDRGDVENPPPR